MMNTAVLAAFNSSFLISRSSFAAGGALGGLAQDFRVGAAEGGYLSRGAVHGLLRGVAGVALDPLPVDAVAFARAVEPLPPLVVRLAAEAPAHRLDDVARVGLDGHAAGLAQLLQAERGRRYLRLLVRRVAEVEAEGPPHALEAQERHGRGARRLLPVAQARTVAVDEDIFHQ